MTIGFIEQMLGTNSKDNGIIGWKSIPIVVRNTIKVVRNIVKVVRNIAKILQNIAKVVWNTAKVVRNIAKVVGYTAKNSWLWYWS